MTFDMTSPHRLPADHIFARNDSASYRNGFCEAAALAYSALSDKAYSSLLTRKFLLSSDHQWSSDQFIQSSCELTIGTGFKTPDISKIVEPDVKIGNGNRDVDWRIVSREWTFNVEVKCSIEDESSTESNELKLVYLGRVNNPKRSLDKANEILSSIGRATRATKHADLRMKDYLINAHSKFGDERLPSELNVLFVACGTPFNMNQWRGYLTGNEGLFTKKSFFDRNAYAHVDTVVLSSVRYLHSVLNARTADSWFLENACNIAICNHPRKPPLDSQCYSAFLDSFPNHTRQFNAYMPDYWRGTPLNNEVKMHHFPTHELNAATRSRYWPGHSFSDNEST